jgi:hypothetical protein
MYVCVGASVCVCVRAMCNDTQLIEEHSTTANRRCVVMCVLSVCNILILASEREPYRHKRQQANAGAIINVCGVYCAMIMCACLWPQFFRV